MKKPKFDDNIRLFALYNPNKEYHNHQRKQPLKEKLTMLAICYSPALLLIPIYLYSR